MSQKAVALFDRAAGKLAQLPGSVPLARARGHGAVLRMLNVVVDDPLARLL